LCLGEIARKLDLSDYNASRHVRILNEAGLLTVLRDGRFKRISIAPAWRANWHKAKAPGTLDLGCCHFDFSKDGKPSGKP
jgi:DNA-binding transcriptional ArsR family regulator